MLKKSIIASVILSSLLMAGGDLAKLPEIVSSEDNLIVTTSGDVIKASAYNNTSDHNYGLNYGQTTTITTETATTAYISTTETAINMMELPSNVGFRECKEILRSGAFEIHNKKMNFDKNKVYFQFDDVIYVIPENIKNPNEICKDTITTGSKDIINLEKILLEIGKS